MPKAGTDYEPSDDKTHTTQKVLSKKGIVTGIWPCKINGCNKQFAREADLKRHQRTTKLHSMPGFACPQCDAAFTRTDALRRHQKSRHNGIIIEPPDQDSKDDAEGIGFSGSPPNSRTGTPSSKGKYRAPPIQPPPPQPARGPSSHYRSHTLTTTPSSYMHRPPAANPHNAPSGPLTSATRINTATTWGHTQPWSNCPPHPPGYQHIHYSPYYRHNGPISHPPGQPPPAGPNQHFERPRTSSTINQAHHTIRPNNSSNTLTKQTSSSPPIIDSTLNTSDPTELTEQQVLEITQAAVQAVLEAEAERSKARSGNESTPAAPASYANIGGDLDTKPDDLSDNLDLSSLHGYALDRSEELEHLLTEDGEPMLHPAELLTQESLASPPPS